MTSQIIQQLEKKTGLTQITVPEPRELIRYHHKNQYTLDKNGNLTGINLCGVELIDQDIQGLFSEENISHLQVLNLSENKLTHLRFPATAKALKYVNLSENETLETLEFEAGLLELETLHATHGTLKTFTLPSGFSNLRLLDLRQNQLEKVELTPRCPKIETLHFGGNQLKEFTLPTGFGNLMYLYLADNQIETLTLNSFLSHLLTLHLRNNRLKELPRNFLTMENLESLYLYENPITGIPKEVIASGEYENSRDSVWDYLKSLERDEARFLHQAKMILVGNGEVGKTSIRIKLIDPKAPLPDKKDRTAGLDVVDYVIEGLEKEITGLDDEIDFQMKIWDFGGQGRYREVQQLFCSRKSLYLFVTAHDDLPEKQDYVGFKYWLSMVNAYSYDEETQVYCPIIHVVNKIDQKNKAINEEERRNVFPNIYPDFIKISCKDLTNFDQLTSAIRKALSKVSEDIFTNPYSRRWLGVKSILEEKAENHITFKEYEILCINCGMGKSEARTWINILDRIGSVIYFGNHPDLKDWVILNPEWVKEAIYKVLDYPGAINGLIFHNMIESIWPDNTVEERQKFLQMMLKYKLCFKQKDHFGNINFVVPALLPDSGPSLPSYLQQPVLEIKFAFEPFIPAGTVNKLIVTLQRGEGEQTKIRELNQPKNPESLARKNLISIYQGMMWKNNVIIQDGIDKAYAHLEEVWADHAIYVKLFGEDIQHLFDQILLTLRSLNKEVQETKYLTKLKMIPQPWYKGDWRPVEDLKKLEAYLFTPITRSAGVADPVAEIKRLIAQTRLGKALKTMLTISGPEKESEVINLQRRWEDYQLEKISGTLRMEELEVRASQITKDTLNLLKIIHNQQQVIQDLPLEIPTEKAPVTDKKRILFLSANPADSVRLAIGEEFDSIRTHLRQTSQRDNFEFLAPELSVTIQNLLLAMNQKPEIIHFAGHGKTGGIMISDQNNKSVIMPNQVLNMLFFQHHQQVQLVVLNSCYSASQAELISKFGIYVVGMNAPIEDDAAIHFAQGLYLGLGEGKEVENAFLDALIVISMKNLAFAGLPELWKDGKKIELGF